MIFDHDKNGVRASRKPEPQVRGRDRPDLPGALSLSSRDRINERRQAAGFRPRSPCHRSGEDSPASDYDALTRIADFALPAANFNQSLPARLPRRSAVPEPTTLGAAGALVMALPHRRSSRGPAAACRRTAVPGRAGSMRHQRPSTHTDYARELLNSEGLQVAESALASRWGIRRISWMNAGLQPPSQELSVAPLDQVLAGPAKVNLAAPAGEACRRARASVDCRGEGPRCERPTKSRRRAFQ